MDSMERLIVAGYQNGMIWLIIYQEKGAIILWDVFHNGPIKTIENEHSSEIVAVKILENKENKDIMFISSDQGGNVNLFKVRKNTFWKYVYEKQRIIEKSEEPIT